MADTRPVFCFISSKTCSHCTTFRHGQKDEKGNIIRQPEWPKVRKALEDTKLVRIVDIDLPNMNTKPDPKYPSELGGLLGWFPMFLLVDSKSWDAKRGDGKFNYRVFNGLVDKDTNKPSHLGPKANPLTEKSMLEWVTSECKEGFGGGVIVQSAAPVPRPRPAGPSEIIYVPTMACKLKIRPKNG